MHRGFWFSLDATLALLVIGMLWVSLPNPKEGDWTSLVVLQKQHDLAIVWQEKRTVSAAECQQDLELVFPANSYRLRMGEDEIEKTVPDWQPNASTIDFTIWVSEKEPVLVSLTVHY